MKKLSTDFKDKSPNININIPKMALINIYKYTINHNKLRISDFTF